MREIIKSRKNKKKKQKQTKKNNYRQDTSLLHLILRVIFAVFSLFCQTLTKLVVDLIVKLKV